MVKFNFEKQEGKNILRECLRSIKMDALTMPIYGLAITPSIKGIFNSFKEKKIVYYIDCIQIGGEIKEGEKDRIAELTPYPGLTDVVTELENDHQGKTICETHTGELALLAVHMGAKDIVCCSNNPIENYLASLNIASCLSLNRDDYCRFVLGEKDSDMFLKQDVFREMVSPTLRQLSLESNYFWQCYFNDPEDIQSAILRKHVTSELDGRRFDLPYTSWYEVYNECQRRLKEDDIKITFSPMHPFEYAMKSEGKCQVDCIMMHETRYNYFSEASLKRIMNGYCIPMLKDNGKILVLRPDGYSSQTRDNLREEQDY